MEKFLFKGKSIFSNEWVYGNYIHDKKDPKLAKEYQIISLETGEEFDVYEDSVNLFIHSFDLNGEMIFTNDVLFNPDIKEFYLVIFESGKISLKSHVSNNVKADYENLVLVGNIFDLKKIFD